MYIAISWQSLLQLSHSVDAVQKPVVYLTASTSDTHEIAGSIPLDGSPQNGANTDSSDVVSCDLIVFDVRASEDSSLRVEG